MDVNGLKSRKTNCEDINIDRAIYTPQNVGVFYLLSG